MAQVGTDYHCKLTNQELCSKHIDIYITRIQFVLCTHQMMKVGTAILMSTKCRVLALFRARGARAVIHPIILASVRITRSALRPCSLKHFFISR